MENELPRPRGVLVSTAGFILGSLGLLLSVFTAFLGQEAVVALTRSFNGQEQIRSPLRTRKPVRRLRRVASDSSLVVHKPPIPTISVTLHKIGNSVSTTHHLLSIAPQVSRPAPPPPPPPSPPSQSPQSKDQWLLLPPIQTRTKRRHKLNRSTSSPQLTSFAAAGMSFASAPPVPPPPGTFSDTDTDGDKRKKKTPKLRLRKKPSQEQAWQNVYLDEEGSPNTTTAPPTTPLHPDPIISSITEDSDSKPRRPRLRKVKTLGDLLRRVPNSPGPSLPNPEKLEFSAKQAFAFASLKSKTPEYEAKKSKSKEDLKIRKRTQPYAAPYFWTPPDQVLALNAQRRRSSVEKQEEVPIQPARAKSQDRVQ